MNILLVGCGKMGGALLARWRDLHLCEDIRVVEPSAVAVPEVRQVRHVSDLPSSFRPDAVVFAVKPQILDDVLPDYKEHAGSGALLLSIAAGKSIASFERHLGTTAKIVRAMPNMPASIGQGITVATANGNVSAAEKDKAAALLGAVGEVLWVGDEKLLNPVTALSGSGPAYIFLLIEVLTQAGTDIGLAPALAEKLARQTVIGSAALTRESAGTPAAALREAVTSPGGTTAAALDILMAKPGGMQDLFTRALKAATKRAEELAG